MYEAEVRGIFIVLLIGLLDLRLQNIRVFYQIIYVCYLLSHPQLVVDKSVFVVNLKPKSLYL